MGSHRDKQDRTADDKGGRPRHAKDQPETKAIVTDHASGYSIKSPGRPEGTAAGDNAGRDR